MRILFKYLLIFIGGILIGFGIGIVSTNFLASQKTGYWIAIVSSLILGGFIVALGIVIGPSKSGLPIKQVTDLGKSSIGDRQIDEKQEKISTENHSNQTENE